MNRAIIFDLDETLYPERRFMLSGFIVVAREVERRYGVAAASAFAVLRRAAASGRRQHALQELVSHFDLSSATVDDLLALYRRHVPRLRLPPTSGRVLAALRADWRIGILTNGYPDIQARKVAALGVSAMVDAVVYGLDTGAGKPELSAFTAVLDRLGVPPRAAVFVGDDPWCDIMGARRAGLKTVRIRRGVHGRVAVASDEEADVAIDSLAEVPAVAAGLVSSAACYVS